MLRLTSLVHAILITSRSELRSMVEITRRCTGEFLSNLFTILMAATDGDSTR